MRIRYLGSIGSYSYEVAKSYSNDLISVKTIYYLFENNKDDFLVIPLENSTSGDVYEAYHAMYDFGFEVINARSLKIDHALIGLKGSNINDLENVYSHPQALLQVSDFLSNYDLIVNPYYSTADAAMYVSEQNDVSLCAISSKSVISLYSNLEILVDSVSNNELNFTRFLVLKPKKKVQYQINLKENNENNLFLLFELKDDKSGELSSLLASLSKYDVNLTNINSHPIKGRSFEYFFVVEGIVKDDLNHEDLCLELKKQTLSFVYNIY